MLNRLNSQPNVSPAAAPCKFALNTELDNLRELAVYLDARAAHRHGVGSGPSDVIMGCVEIKPTANRKFKVIAFVLHSGLVFDAFQRLHDDSLVYLRIDEFEELPQQPATSVCEMGFRLCVGAARPSDW